MAANALDSSENVTMSIHDTVATLDSPLPELSLRLSEPISSTMDPSIPMPAPPDNRGSGYSAYSDIEKKSEEALLQWKPQRQEYLVMVTMAMASLMVALDATVLVCVLPTLALDLHGSATVALWAGTSYLISHAVWQPFLASLSDIFGRQLLVLTSLLFFAIGSIICATSNGFTQLITGRVIQGIGGAGIITLAQVIFADMVPLRWRPKYFALVLLAWAIGSITGPIIGAAFAQKTTWRWIFWINLPLCGIAMSMCILFLRFDLHHSSVKSKLASVDWIGGFVFIASLTSFLVAISWGGIQFAWSSYHTLVPLILGVFGIVGAVVLETSVIKQPFLPKGLFTNLDMVPAYLCALFNGLVVYMGLYYFPFYFLSVHLYSEIRSGVDMLPGTVFMLPGSVIVSILISRFASYRHFVWAGFVTTTIGAGILISVTVSIPTAVIFVGMAVFATGSGMVLSSVNFSIQSIIVDTNPELASAAAAMYTFMRSTGMCIGVAVGGTVFQNFLLHRLREYHLDEGIAKNAEAFLLELRKLPVNSHDRELILKSYAYGIKGTMIIMTVIGGLAVVTSFLIKHHDMERVLVPRQKLRR